MLLTKEVMANITDRNAKIYEQKGYEIKRKQGFRNLVVEKNQTINVRVEDLPSGTKQEVKVKCDYCGDETTKLYKHYLKQREIVPKDACKKCTRLKEHDIHGKEIEEIRSKTRASNLGINIQDIKKSVEEQGYIVKNDVPEENDDSFRFELKCKHGHDVNVLYKTLKINKNVHCRSCYLNEAINSGEYSLAKTHSQFVKEMSEKHKNIIVLGKYKNSKKNIECLCVDCNNTWHPIPNDLLSKGAGCPFCNETNNVQENILYEYISEYYKDVKRQVKFDGLVGVGGHRLSFDFMLIKDGESFLIERQGEQHLKPIERFGGVKTFERQQEHDKRKREYAKQNGYTLIEIWYYEDYKEKLKQYGLC